MIRGATITKDLAIIVVKLGEDKIIQGYYSTIHTAIGFFNDFQLSFKIISHSRERNLSIINFITYFNIVC
jgi:hypothetical protein